MSVGIVTLKALSPKVCRPVSEDWRIHDGVYGWRKAMEGMVDDKADLEVNV